MPAPGFASAKPESGRCAGQAWAYLLPLGDDAGRAAQLYVKPDDRWELNDVLQHHPALAEHLDAVLRGFMAAIRQPGPLQAPALRDVEAEPEITA